MPRTLCSPMEDRDRRHHARAIRDRLDDPYALCEALGLIEGRRSYQRQAQGLLIRCPLHGERTPSCSVTLGRDGTVRFRCFGCDSTGDALDLVAAARSLDSKRDFPRVLQEAAALAGHPLGPRMPTPSRIPRRPALQAHPSISEDTFDTLVRVLTRLCPLERQPDVCEYLERRGLVEEDCVSIFALPEGSQEQNRLREAMIAEVGGENWLRSGLARRDGTWQWPEHRLVIPWHATGVDGLVTTLQRRLIRDPRPGECKYVFPSRRPPPAPFGACDALEILGIGTALAFTESALDALSLRKALRSEGLDLAVVGLPSSSAMRPAWADLARGRTAYVAFDADPAGDRASQKAAEMLRQHGATRVARLRPRDLKDWNDRFTNQGDDR